MASTPQQPADVELRGPEIAKPRPLRIVKRGQTVTGCPSPGTLVNGGGGISDCTDEGGGSPPSGADRPLTVRKTRRTRGSILNGSLEEGPAEHSPGSAILSLIERNSPWRTKQGDPNTAPKSRKSTTGTASIGIHTAPKQSANVSKPPVGEHSIRDDDDVPTQDDKARLVSRSKKPFLKSIPGRNYSGSVAQKAIRRISSNITKRIKRPIRAEQDGSSFYGGDTNLTLSAMSCSDIEETANTGIQSGVAFHTVGKTSPPLPTLDSLYTMCLRGSYVLCPQINVTPELTVVDTSMCSLWVAVEVIGVLRRADGQEEYGNGAERYPSHSSSQPADLRCYGRLHSMRLDLLPSRDCMISEIFGNLRELKTLGAKETYLVLVKIRLSEITSLHENTQDIAAPDALIAGLESDLSNIVTPYLMARVTYKHSGFLDQEPTSSPTETGMSTYMTRMQSEATAIIQRTNLQSQWSPRTSRTIDGSANINPLIKLIETHFPVDKARAALRRLANDRVQIPPARRVRRGDQPAGSSEETVKPHHMSSLAAKLDSIAAVPLRLGSMTFDGTAESTAKENGEEGDDRDPARKIWTEMRRTSRGDHNRSSPSNSCRVDDPDGSTIRTSSIEIAVEDERYRIKETALKNKRSLGSDSLRSIAPSVSTTDTKPARSNTGVGLGLGSSWAWVGPWW